MRSLLAKLFWKSLRSNDRDFILNSLPVVERGGFNHVLSQKHLLSPAFIDKNCLFIHVPKCAGSSITQSLFNDSTAGHLPLTYYERVFPDFYKSSFKFAFVRDPLDRAASAYNYLSQENFIARDKDAFELVRSYKDFDSFVKGWLCRENVEKQMHFAPQWRFLCNTLGRVAVDFIGRHENMAEDFDRVCSKLGIARDLPQTNKSRIASADTLAHCSPESKAIIFETYKRDYELFGYVMP